MVQLAGWAVVQEVEVHARIIREGEGLVVKVTMEVMAAILQMHMVVEVVEVPVRLVVMVLVPQGVMVVMVNLLL